MSDWEKFAVALDAFEEDVRELLTDLFAPVFNWLSEKLNDRF